MVAIDSHPWIGGKAVQKIVTPQNTAAERVLNPMVQVVACPTYQAFRRADVHTTPLGKASGLQLSAQEHIQLANIPGSKACDYMPIQLAGGFFISEKKGKLLV